MSGEGVAAAAVLAAVLAWVGAALLARAAGSRAIALDAADGPRKVHTQPTPRIGGLAVLAGLLGACAAGWWLNGELGAWALVLLLCAAPGLIWGLIEDFSMRGAAGARLALTAAGAGLGYVLLDARITQVGVPGIDSLLAIHVLSFAFTLLAVSGVAHAVNLIDGLNGLSGISALCASVGLAAIAWAVGDSFVSSTAAALAGSLAGFLLINFPRGRIFLGDGGAYLVGLLLAVLSVLLVHRNSEVSPWFPLVLLAYPIWETLFSMYRRWARGRAASEADRLHLHSLVYRRLVRWKGYAASPAESATRNAIASACLWPLPLACLAVALAFWDDTPTLQLAATGFASFYIWSYLRIARFGVSSRWRIGSPSLPRPLLAPRPDSEGRNAV